MRVERWDSAKDGPVTEAALRSKLERMGFWVTRYVYPAGTSFPTHTHDCEKIDAVVSGQFRITMGDESVLLSSGDAVYVPKGAKHSAEVVGDVPVVSLDGLKSSP